MVGSESENPCYTNKKLAHRWQGDIYSSEDFKENSHLPESVHLKYWMLLNRTCHMVEGGVDNREVKYSHLTFSPVLSLERIFKGSKKTPKNQISNLLDGKSDNIVYLPKHDQHGLNIDAAVDFNLVYSISLDKTPESNQKLVQLSSPFCEHLMQRFSRYYFSIGFDDDEYKSKQNKDRLLKELELGD